MCCSSLSADIFEPCPRNGPDFEGCAKRNIQKAVVKFSAGECSNTKLRRLFGRHCVKVCIIRDNCCFALSTGVPALGLPPYDPLFAPEVWLNYKQDAVEGSVIAKNSKFYGLKDIDILDFRLSTAAAGAVKVTFIFWLCVRFQCRR
jgi:hypothetical protein